MKKPLWFVIIVVAAFLGFLMGYSFPPFVQTGFAGAGGKPPQTGPRMDKSTQDYYKSLYQDEK